MNPPSSPSPGAHRNGSASNGSARNRSRHSSDASAPAVPGSTPPLKPADDDAASIPVLWFVVSSVIHAILIAGSNTTLWSSHFRSWSTLSQDPTETLPQLLERSEDLFAAAALIVGVVLGVTATKRLARGEYGPVLIRMAVLAFVPIFIESSTFGVQDGSPQDLNLIPLHSVALLIGLPLGALVASAIDLSRLRRPFER